MNQVATSKEEILKASWALIGKGDRKRSMAYARKKKKTILAYGE